MENLVVNRSNFMMDSHMGDFLNRLNRRDDQVKSEREAIRQWCMDYLCHLYDIENQRLTLKLGGKDRSHIEERVNYKIPDVDVIVGHIHFWEKMFADFDPKKNIEWSTSIIKH